MQIRSMFERYYSISDAFQEADAVARVTVGDWQGEDLHNWVTFFDADVQESYKGDLPRHFTLVQGGCSEASSPNYPLFINGTELGLRGRRAVPGGEGPQGLGRAQAHRLLL